MGGNRQRTIRLETDSPENAGYVYPKIGKTISCLPLYVQKNQCDIVGFGYYLSEKIRSIFTFKNIYLPGTQNRKMYRKRIHQKGMLNIASALQKNFHKKKTKSRTAIILIKTKPIITNYATTRFYPWYFLLEFKAGY